MDHEMAATSKHFKKYQQKLDFSKSEELLFGAYDAASPN